MPRATRSSTKAAATPADAPAATNTTTAAATDTTAAPAPASKAKATKKAPASKKRTRADTDKDDTVDTSKPASTKRAKKNATKDDAADADVDVADAAPATASNDASGSNNQPQTDAKDAAPAKSETPEPPAKMVSVLKRGAAPVDPLSPHLVSTHQVYVDDQGEIWDAMLNQTDALNNNNKFYVIQLLHPTSNRNSVSLHVRWGRVGENGSSQDKGPWSPAQAVQEFQKQFKSKSGADWKNRRSMQPKKGKYMWLERAYGDEEEDNGKGKGKEEDGPRAKTPEPTLGPELLDLANLIFSVSLIQAALSEMNYDANKLPLGKLAKSTILNGFTALKGIAEVLAEPNGTKATELGGQRKACIELTNAYYSVIPHSFGRRHPIIIDRPEILKRELELVDALGDMEIANKIMSDSRPKDADGNPLNPLDANMRSLDLKFVDPVARDSKEWATIANYMTGTHGATHSHYRGELRNLFRVERHGETDNWNNAGWGKLADGEKMLLWHGSRSTNFAGILKQGLRIAPPEAPVTGYMFGKGVYFADAFSKSANYCHAGQSKNIGIMLLCEVAVKPYLELNDSDYYADQHSKDNKKIATKGVGMAQPTEWQDCSDALGWNDLKGVVMPKGGLAQVKPPGAWLQYNEYIVYSPSQIRVRYLLMVDMKSR
ncbi:poly [Rhizoctonia solani]|uniref:Poly [ADP-ribose] polymerase n=1 Tax=Rhizoctonia solani TaxID=456999 RepID=A0A0K6GDW5_9AGAM|nr:poly [Rhizoctonia solani]